MALQQTVPSAARVISSVSPRDDQVSIGPVLPDDMGALFVWRNDADTAVSDMTYRPIDGIAFKGWLEEQTRQQLLFSVRTIQPPRLVGFVIFKNLQPVTRAAEIGVRIGIEPDRGQGLGTRATRLALAYAWRTLNLHRVSLTVFADNLRAIASYRSAGFEQEGVMRQAAFTAGIWRDVVVMAAINPDG